MFTRRRFLVLFPAFAASARAFAAWPIRKKKIVPPPPIHVFFGTDTNKGVCKGIYRSVFDPALGQLDPPVLIAATARPSYLAVSPPGSSRRSLYAVNAINDPAATVTTFMLDPGTGNLQQTGQVPSGGAGPAYVSVDSTGHAAFVANYMGASIASYRVQPDGTLSQPVERLDFKDHQKFGALGPNSARQENSHPHCVTISPDDRFLLVCDLGTDHISVFYIHPETGQLSDPHLFTNERPGSGPRHVVFHPNGRWVYCINEIDSSIDRCLWTATRFSNTPQGLLVNSTFSIRTIAPDFPAEKNTAAEIAISPDGNFLYASNRGEDSLVVFSIAKNGDLTLLQRIACGGKTPRHFTLDPTAQWLLCGNQDSANVTVFRRDAATGKLSGPAQTVALDSPLFTLFA
ncbi:lactonase family protein [Tunturiibacter gelidoferens]|uniref:6-phosphogluconolactonase n=1 Tax=Tunturiibacter gelidiferens TaxID=3069689 RepID=A0ACC5P5L7_9BACT|nr:lactonase family protein [Edaphobacter lichenicola]MBB5341946.1 6-phosphogluconolactonase [Edaphobacter lichenicola]